MFKRQIKIPSAEEIIEKTPLSAALKKLKAERDGLIKDVLTGESDKFLVIVGPCSAHDAAPVLEYAERLGKLNEKVKDKLVIIPRVYTSKPRTRGVGYMGMFFQPDPDKPVNALEGIYAARNLNIGVMEASGLTAADEVLYPENYFYLADLISYAAVGARSSENPLHRQTASGADGAAGIKNPLNGSISALLNSINAAQSAQEFLLGGWQVKTEGNPLAHGVLRGRVNENGEDIPNYDTDTVMRVVEGYSRLNLQFPALVIDCNHSNSGKNFLKQIDICKEVLQNRKANSDYKRIVKGVMIESFLKEGCQSANAEYGKSITDPCLGWEDTERLIYCIAEAV